MKQNYHNRSSFLLQDRQTCIGDGLLTTGRIAGRKGKVGERMDIRLCVSIRWLVKDIVIASPQCWKKKKLGHCGFAIRSFCRKSHIRLEDESFVNNANGLSPSGMLENDNGKRTSDSSSLFHYLDRISSMGSSYFIGFHNLASSWRVRNAAETIRFNIRIIHPIPQNKWNAMRCSMLSN